MTYQPPDFILQAVSKGFIILPRSKMGRPRIYANPEEARIAKLWAIRGRRADNLARGLTQQGTPRKRSYAKLGGMTPEQKRQRHLAQQRAWRKDQ